MASILPMFILFFAWQAALWCAGIFAVFLAISLNLYRKATA